MSTMEVLWVVPDVINVDPIVKSLGDHWGDRVSCLRYQNRPDHLILSYLQKPDVNPDIVLFIGAAEGPMVPEMETMRVIRDEVRHVVHLVFDGSCSGWRPLLKKYDEAEIFDLQVNIDGNVNWHSGLKGRVLTTLAPIDPTPYAIRAHIPWTGKPIELGFWGGTGSIERRELLYALGDRVTKYERGHQTLGYEAYADFMTKCRMVLNMPYGGSNNNQVKARVVETALAGGVLVEDRKAITSQYFKPGVHYIPYDTPTDILVAVDSMSSNPKKGEEMAAAFNREYLAKYSPGVFWTLVRSTLV